MKHLGWMACVIILAALFGGAPEAGTDVARLQPVEVVRIIKDWRTIHIETDTGASGEGESFADALEDLHQTAQGTVFLDTAEYLIVSEGAMDIIPELTEFLRPGCCVCKEKGEPDMEHVALFFATHDPGVTLKDYRAGSTDIPVLKTREGKMHLEYK